MQINRYYVLYNPYANNGNCEADARLLHAVYSEELVYVDLQKLQITPCFLAV